MAKYCQIILLNSDGFIIDSDDFLFDTQMIREKSIRAYSPFIDSIFDKITALSINDSPLQFPSVNANSKYLKGIFDYRFSRPNESQILWMIEDCTKVYEKNRAEMQTKNDAIIAKERKSK